MKMLGLFWPLVLLALLLSVKAQAAEAPARWSQATGAPTHCVSQAEYRAVAEEIETEWLGKTEFDDESVTVLLSPRTCMLLLRRGLPPWARVDAVFTLAHEAAHVRGVWSERKADQWAKRNLRRIARLAGYRFSERSILAYLAGG